MREVIVRSTAIGCLAMVPMIEQGYSQRIMKGRRW